MLTLLGGLGLWGRILASPKVSCSVQVTRLSCLSIAGRRSSPFNRRDLICASSARVVDGCQLGGVVVTSHWYRAKTSQLPVFSTISLGQWPSAESQRIERSGITASTVPVRTKRPASRISTC